MTLGRDDPVLRVASSVVRDESGAITHPRGTICLRVTESVAEQMLKVEGLLLFFTSSSIMAPAPPSVQDTRPRSPLSRAGSPDPAAAALHGFH